MPLSMVKAGEPNVIKKVGGKSETKKFLENLGFVVGGLVTVISDTAPRWRGAVQPGPGVRQLRAPLQGGHPRS